MSNECPRGRTRRPLASVPIAFGARGSRCWGGLTLSHVCCHTLPGCRNVSEALRVCGLRLVTRVRLMPIVTTFETNVLRNLARRRAARAAEEQRRRRGITRVRCLEGVVRSRGGDELRGRGCPVEGSPGSSFRVGGRVEEGWEGHRVLLSKGSPSLLDVII
jgi:hypothetical protein